MRDWPLAIAVGRVVADDHLRDVHWPVDAQDEHPPDSLQVVFSEDQEWYYLTSHRTDEMIIINYNEEL